MDVFHSCLIDLVMFIVEVFFWTEEQRMTTKKETNDLVASWNAIRPYFRREKTNLESKLYVLWWLFELFSALSKGQLSFLF